MVAIDWPTFVSNSVLLDNCNVEQALSYLTAVICCMFICHSAYLHGYSVTRVRVLSDVCATALLASTVIFYALPDPSTYKNRETDVIWCKMVAPSLLLLLECADTYVIWHRYEAVYSTLHLGAYLSQNDGPSEWDVVTRHLTLVKWAVVIFCFVFFFGFSTAFGLVYPWFVDLNTPTAYRVAHISVNYVKPISYIVLSAGFTALVLRLIHVFHGQSSPQPSGALGCCLSDSLCLFFRIILRMFS
jgi:hypothetical protein